eukprot:TRINITY_DN600_c0_g1_i1.p1 TRINITY_DN600_c0_g1~~TRINITY_DN600_c0_g1_i1.p1  ORF type:complete len:296 (+),score=91.99 TRINITY_DN600_c0_g1_i1:63-950(+)
MDGFISYMKDTVAGGFGGMCLVLVGHPLDTIKVRLQTMPVPKIGESPLYKGSIDCAMKTVRNEGVLGLYKGMGAPLLTVTPMFAICFFGYSIGKKLQLKEGQTNDDLNLFHIWNAGCLSGVFTTLTTMVPGERIKCLLQIQGQPGAKQLYKGPLDCAVKILRTEGVMGLYRGTFATLCRDVPGSGAYFVAYEGFKRLLIPKDESSKKKIVLATLFSGGMAGIFNWIVSIPPDVIKSRIQTAPEGKYKGVVDCVKQLIKNEGVMAMYKGVGPVMLRAFPANAACFMGYEFCKKLMG